MLSDIRARALLGQFRGLPLWTGRPSAGVLQRVGEIALIHPEIAEIDINPLIIAGSRPSPRTPCSSWVPLFPLDNDPLLVIGLSVMRRPFLAYHVEKLKIRAGRSGRKPPRPLREGTEGWGEVAPSGNSPPLAGGD